MKYLGIYGNVVVVFAVSMGIGIGVGFCLGTEVVNGIVLIIVDNGVGFVTVTVTGPMVWCWPWHSH
jgi:hypothetical protein